MAGGGGGVAADDVSMAGFHDKNSRVVGTWKVLVPPHGPPPPTHAASPSHHRPFTQYMHPIHIDCSHPSISHGSCF
ncbi:hypothetical protein E2C01_092346 [Portunus trituberculatus]|uniref:Uncharacterized protein n=1 Tax=Portunus trituberculatus TaxID=210409 RepID=A0A5B7JV80_PORTR|nr:hypothetical protein [Portunus trituberculatus]